jgi:hypothetical protein
MEQPHVDSPTIWLDAARMCIDHILMDEIHQAWHQSLSI